MLFLDSASETKNQEWNEMYFICTKKPARICRTYGWIKSNKWNIVYYTSMGGKTPIKLHIKKKRNVDRNGIDFLLELGK